MDMWKILVLGVLKQGLGCDRIHELANQHKTVRQGHADFADDTRYEYQTVLDNISLLTPELLSEVQNLVVKIGHEVAKKPLATPCEAVVIHSLWKPMFITRPICYGSVVWSEKPARRLRSSKLRGGGNLKN